MMKIKHISALPRLTCYAKCIVFAMFIFTPITPSANTVLKLTIPSFGQSVALGTLFDARTQTFFPGASIFTQDFIIPSNNIERIEDFESVNQIQQINSTQSKFKETNFSNALILSILSEEIPVDIGGSWRYLVEEPRKESVIHNTELRTKWQKEFSKKLGFNDVYYSDGTLLSLTMPLNMANNLFLEGLLAKENENATHFVLGITYGKHIGAVFHEDSLRERRYGSSQEDHDSSNSSFANGNLEIEEWAENIDVGRHNHTVNLNPSIRLYTDHARSPRQKMTNEELYNYFQNFPEKSHKKVVPLLYELLPLSSILNFLEPDDNTRTKLTRRWGSENFMGDPPIESSVMNSIYEAFDNISIVEFKMETVMEKVTDTSVHSPKRNEDCMEMTSTFLNFERAIEEFKADLRKILKEYRIGQMREETFEKALEGVLKKHQRGEHSPEKTEKILDTEMKALNHPLATEFENFGRTVGNIYAELENLLI